MKRFYCTICQRVKRVRSLPTNVVTPRAQFPEQRVGTCDKHGSTARNEFNSIVRVRKAN